MDDNKETFQVKKIHIWQGLTAIFAILFIVSIVTNGFSGSSNGNTGVTGNAVNNQPTGNGNGGTVNAKLDLSDNYFVGDKNAKVKIIEFSDYQCPFCGRFYAQTLPEIEKNYIETGKAVLYFVDFPLESIHPQARPAALAARCAGEQDKYFEYHNVLFEKQTEWSSVGETFFKQYAKDLGLNTDKFDSCFDSNKYGKNIDSDLKDATSAGGRGTPYFLINDKPLSGAQPFTAFQALIDGELN